MINGASILPIEGTMTLLSAIVLGLSLMAAAGCGGAPADARPNIVVLVLDTARPDLLSVYGHSRPTSPFLESFAAQGTRFDRAYSSSSWTLPAHASLFTGAAPEVHEANQTSKRVADSMPLLAEQLAAAGYQTAGFSGNMWMSELGGLERGFQHFENRNRRIYPKHTRTLAADRRGKTVLARSHYVASRVFEWIERKLTDDQPFFLFVNLVEPHQPYLPDWDAAQHFLPEQSARWNAIQRYFPNSNATRLLYRHYARQNPLTADEWKIVTGMYEGALRLVDKITGEIIQAIDSVSDPENTLVFILSDHGENLGDHGHLTHIFNLYDSNLRILCIARGPGIPVGAVDERVVHITDIYKTVLSVAGIEAASDSGGLDLRGEIPDDRVVYASLEYPRISLGLFSKKFRGREWLEPYRVRLRAAIGPRFKLIRSLDESGRVVRDEFYDLIADPGEDRPLAAGAVDPHALRGLEEALRSHGSTAEGVSERSLDTLPEEVRDGLRALGYLGDEGNDDGERPN